MTSKVFAVKYYINQLSKKEEIDCQKNKRYRFNYVYFIAYTTHTKINK